MGAISSVNVLFTDIGAEQAHALANVLKEHVTLKSLCGNKGNETELDMSGKKIGADGAIMLGPEIADNGAILSVNLLKNGIGVEQAGHLVIILKDHPTLKSLCGNNGTETEFDMSGKMKGAEDAIMLAAEVVDNRAMTSLSLASNDLGVEGAKIIAAFLPICT
jgi:hypothetical protein